MYPQTQRRSVLPEMSIYLHVLQKSQHSFLKINNNMSETRQEHTPVWEIIEKIGNVGIHMI